MRTVDRLFNKESTASFWRLYLKANDQISLIRGWFKTRKWLYPITSSSYALSCGVIVGIGFNQWVYLIYSPPDDYITMLMLRAGAIILMGIGVMMMGIGVMMFFRPLGGWWGRGNEERPLPPDDDPGGIQVPLSPSKPIPEFVASESRKAMSYPVVARPSIPVKR